VTTTTPTGDVEQDTEAVEAVETEAAPGPERRWVRRTLIGSAIALLLLGITAAAAVAYDNSHRDELMPGVRIDGRLVGGTEAAVVLRELQSRVPAVGQSTVQVTAGPFSDRLTLQEMGLHSDAADVMERVRADADDMGLLRRVWHRLRDKPVRKSYEVRLHVDRNEVRDQLIALGQKVERKPENARIDTSSGFVSIVPAVDGRSLDLTAATNRVFARGERLAAAPGSEGGTVVAPLVMSKPKITGFADVILVRTGENRLYHYENGVLVRTYTVATGTPGYPTPKGNFQIVLKRFRPTWVNPDPSGWGKSLPKSIPPGPGNPLGTRAMNLNAPGIRIHGTSNVRSLGTAASHGCIRMAMPEVEELFDKVENGTPVIIITGPPKAAPAPAAPSTVIGDPNAPVDLEAG
jgi:lipoprotein-anchoring transpeptidase ErfK/SrfK